MSSVYANTDDVVAQIVGESVVMDEVAEGIAALARANASRHTSQSWDANDAGDHYEGQIKVIEAGGGKDRLIINTDPLAVPKELGHLLVRGRGPDAQVVGYVHGQYSMRNASLQFPGVFL